MRFEWLQPVTSPPQAKNLRTKDSVYRNSANTCLSNQDTTDDIRLLRLLRAWHCSIQAPYERYADIATVLQAFVGNQNSPVAQTNSDLADLAGCCSFTLQWRELTEPVSYSVSYLNSCVQLRPPREFAKPDIVIPGERVPALLPGRRSAEFSILN